MPRISIIIPTYNSEPTVRAALESVRLQTYPDWECIVVDGASKDDTIKIVKEFCDHDSRFRYISEKDHGIYDAFNKGWKKAKGQWIHYLGSDDSLTEDGMGIVAEQLDDSFAIVTGDVILCRDDGSRRIHNFNGFMGCHQGVLMQRTVIEKLGGFDERYKIIADYDLLMRAQKAGYKARNVRVIIANFALDGVSQKVSSQWKVMKEAYRINKTNKVTRCPLLQSFCNFITISLSHLYRKAIRLLRKKNNI